MFQALVIACSTFVLYVVMSQAVVSLLGRPVRLASVDRLVVQPHHRRGILLPLALVGAVAVALITQAIVVVGLIASQDIAVTAILISELVAAAVWTLVLVIPRRAADDAARQ